MGKENRGSIARRLRVALAALSVIAVGSLAVPASGAAANHGDLTPQFCLEDPDTGPDSCVPALNVALVGLRTLTTGPGGPASEYDHIYAASEVGDAVSIVLDGGFFSPITCIRRASAASSRAISSLNSAAGMNAGRTPRFSLPLTNSADSTVLRIAPSS